jgi:hypothetical protein
MVRRQTGGPAASEASVPGQVWQVPATAKDSPAKDSPAEDHTASTNTIEVYGFLGWITSSVLYCMYIVWSCTPDGLLHWHGVTYYPDKYWALAVPTWVCVTVVAACCMYECLSGMRSQALMAKRRQEELLQTAGRDAERRGQSGS